MRFIKAFSRVLNGTFTNQWNTEVQDTVTLFQVDSIDTKGGKK